MDTVGEKLVTRDGHFKAQSSDVLFSAAYLELTSF